MHTTIFVESTCNIIVEVLFLRLCTFNIHNEIEGESG